MKETLFPQKKRKKKNLFLFADFAQVLLEDQCVVIVSLSFSQFDVFLGASLYAIFSFGVIGTEEIFTVWCSTEIRYGQYIFYHLNSYL